MRATLNAYLDAWITTIEKEYVWTAITFDIPMGEKKNIKKQAAAQGARAPMALEYPKTTFTLTPMQIKVTEVWRNEYPPVDFKGEQPQVIRDLVPMGDYALSSGNGQIMLYTDMAPGDMMLLKAAARNGGAWGDVRTLTQTEGAIVDTAAAAAGDACMAVWSEIASGDVNNIYAPSTLRYALRNASGEWSEAGTVAALDGLGIELRLMPLGNTVALVFLKTDEGPGANTFAVQGTVWDGSLWSEPVEIASYTDMTDFDAAGSTNVSAQPACIVYADLEGVLHAIDWDGTAAVTVPYEPLSEASVTVEDVSLILGADGYHYLAYSSEGSGIGLATRSPGAAWADRGICFADIDPEDLKIAFLEGSTVPVLLYVWTEGGGVSSLQYGYTNTDGIMRVHASDLTGNVTGSYSDIALLPEREQQAAVMARFRNNAVEELRSFTVSYPGGPVFSDIDEDGMDDRAELLVVDANTEDDIQTIYDVFPGDDFDGDGYGNAEEIRAGADPSWAGDHPWYGDIRRDGVLDLADVILGLQVLTNTQGAHTDTVADVNLDGCIGHYEILYVLRALSTAQ